MLRRPVLDEAISAPDEGFLLVRELPLTSGLAGSFSSGERSRDLHPLPLADRQASPVLGAARLLACGPRGGAAMSGAR